MQFNITTTKTAFSNMYFAYDASTRVVLWRQHYWPGWPKMKPATPDILISSFLDFHIPATIDEFNSFSVRYYDNNLSITDEYYTDLDRERFCLSKLKCQKIYRWLNTLYKKLTNSQGILPGIHNSILGSYEEQLYIQEEQKVKSLINEIMFEFHDNLWLAKTEDEFNDLFIEATRKWIIV